MFSTIAAGRGVGDFHRQRVVLILHIAGAETRRCKKNNTHLHKPCTLTQRECIFLFTYPDPTPYDFGARLGLRLLVLLRPGTRYIGILLVVHLILNRGAWIIYAAWGACIFWAATCQSVTNQLSVICCMRQTMMRVEALSLAIRTAEVAPKRL